MIFMKKLIQIFYGILLCVTLNCFISSCSDDSNDLPNNDPADIVLKKASISWNSSVEQIKNHMNGYTLVEADENFLQYTDNAGSTISYSFSNDSLIATVSIFPKLSDIDLKHYLQGYTILGELSSKNVYYNSTVNAMCFTYDVTDDETDYTVLGFTPITSNLYANVDPIIVTTKEATNIGTTYATIKGSIAGVSKSCTCGVRFSTDKNFESSSTKETTSRGNFSLKISYLKKKTVYYFQCYGIVDDIPYYGDVMSFTTL